MFRSPLDYQSALPRAVHLFRYLPDRAGFSWKDWDPARVRSPADLPQYLILGELDPASFSLTASAWSARWQGTEPGTRFEASYDKKAKCWTIGQTWHDADGGRCVFQDRIPLEKMIPQGLYRRFPPSWAEAATRRLESEYQIRVVGQPEGAYTFCGIPDGMLQSIVFPLSWRSLRPLQQWVAQLLTDPPPTYPVSVRAKRLFQAVNYVEGKAPAWTCDEALVFKRSIAETGLVPEGIPVRELARDGSAAWTLRRESYVVFIDLPFAGVTDFLRRAAGSKGPVRRTTDPELRFEQAPLLVPTGLEIQTESLELWDAQGTTRSFLQFMRPGDASNDTEREDVIPPEREGAATLARIEEIGGEIMTAIEEILRAADEEGAPLRHDVTEFEVDPDGTLRVVGYEEARTREDVYQHVADDWSHSPAALADAMDCCQPLAWAVQSIYADYRDELEAEILYADDDDLDERKRLDALRARLRKLPEEPEEGAEDWLLGLTQPEFEERVRPVIAQWFDAEPDWRFEDTFLPRLGTSQGAALDYFSAMEPRKRKLLQVRVVEGDVPGSSYYAAELLGEIEAANAAAIEHGIPVRFVRSG